MRDSGSNREMVETRKVSAVLDRRHNDLERDRSLGSARALTFAAQKSKLASGTPTIFILTLSVNLRSNSRCPIAASSSYCGVVRILISDCRQRGRKERSREGERGQTTHQFEELSLLEEEHRIVMVLLDLPELSLKGREGGPGGFGNVERAGVVAWVGRAVLVGLLLVCEGTMGGEAQAGGGEGQ